MITAVRVRSWLSIAGIPVRQVLSISRALENSHNYDARTRMHERFDARHDALQHILQERWSLSGEAPQNICNEYTSAVLPTSMGYGSTARSLKVVTLTTHRRVKSHEVRAIFS